MRSDWFDNDDLFINKLREGHLEALRVAKTLEERRLAVEVTPMRIRAEIENRGEFADEHDLLVGTAQPCRIDVKSRTLTFFGPHDYPYATALVDTVSGWEQKIHKPLAIVLVSQPTGGLAVIRASGASRWRSKRRYDRDRRIHDWFLEVDRQELATFEEFVAWLNERESVVRS